jgi:DNA-binding response OmpR family regulator
MPRDENHPKPAAARPPVKRTTGVTEPTPDVDTAALSALSERHGVPAVDLGHVSFPLTNLELIPLEIARRHVVMPVLVDDDSICLAMADPTERRVIEELEFVSGRRVFPYVAAADQIRWAIEQLYAARDRGVTNYTGSRVTPPGSTPAPGASRAAVSAPAPIAPAVTSATPARAPVGFDGDDDLADPDLRADAGGPSLPVPTLDSVFTPLDQIQGTTVLVVDDEESIRKLVRRVLEEKGHRVIEADRGSVALAMVKQYVPDAIVLDAMLPELHGFDICRRIKASVRYGHIPILMISAVYRGWRFAEDLKAAYGVNAYIEKPFRIADLVAAVENMLAGAPKADGRDPEALTAEAEAALQSGMESYKRGEIDAAIQKLEQAIRLDPLSYRLHYHLALLVGRKGDTFRAIQELETAIDIHPKSFAALKNLAVLYQKAGFKHKAIEMWERAIGQSPDDATRGQIKEHLMSLL